MLGFISDFGHCFQTKSVDAVDLARRYLSGLLTQVPRKNMERIDERMAGPQAAGTDHYQRLQQFISDSPWGEDLLYQEIAVRANARLGGRPESLLIIDESAHAKKGPAFAGTSRQWNGRPGKQDNCQVGVHSVLNCGAHSALTGTRLFLPDEWTSDEARCRKAGVPDERNDRGALTKIQLAGELITQAVTHGVKFACVAFDSFYGRDSVLRRSLSGQGLIYCADVPVNTRVFIEKPLTENRPGKITPATLAVEEQARKMMADPKHPGRSILLREGENGQVKSMVWSCRVWEWPERESAAEGLWLIVREASDGSLKYSLSNAPVSTSLARLARWQAGRFYVERCFQDAKSQCGMSQYQARGWRAWHHHMALVSLALLFLMKERLLNPMGLSLLSAADVVELLDWALVSRPTEEQMLQRVQRRHAQRARNGSNASARDRDRRTRKNKDVGKKSTAGS